jgi:hypothetical protein
VLVGLLLVTRGGSLLKHALGVLLLAWRRILLAGSAAAIAGVLIGEAGAVAITGRIPPPLLAHVIVLLFAAALAYCTAFTVLLDEIIHGILNTIRMLEGDVTAGARAAAVIAEREAGEAGTGLMRIFGKKAPKPPAAETAGAFVAPAAAEARALEVAQTQADVEATEQFITTGPRPRVDARPVRADQLPRIGWTAEQEAQIAAAVAAPAAAATAPLVAQEEPVGSSSSGQALLLPPIPVRTPSAAPAAPEPASPVPDADMPAPDGEDERTTWSPPSSVSISPPMPADDADSLAYGEASRPTRPLSRPNSRPLDAAPDPSAGRGIWSRISQALVGNTDSTDSTDGSVATQHEETPVQDAGDSPA